MRNARQYVDVFLLAAAGLLSLAILSGCAGHEPPLQNARTAVIPGRDTAGLSQADAQEEVLAKAARITVDHGFRYFTLAKVPPSAQAATAPVALTPGAGITIRLFHEGEIKPSRPGTWDAFRILSQNKNATG